MMRPGGWPDVDMIGGHWMADQERFHLSLIAIIGSPLLLSWDIRDKAKSTLGIDAYLNPEMIAIHQNLGRGPRQAYYARIKGGSLAASGAYVLTDQVCNASDPAQQWELNNVFTGKVTLRPCADELSQRWALESKHLTAVSHPGLCLRALPKVPGSGAALVAEPCLDSAEFNWLYNESASHFESEQTQHCTVQEQKGHMCHQCLDAGNHLGPDVNLWDCKRPQDSSPKNQEWKYEDTAGRIILNATGQCLALDGEPSTGTLGTISAAGRPGWCLGAWSGFPGGCPDGVAVVLLPCPGKSGATLCNDGDNYIWNVTRPDAKSQDMVRISAKRPAAGGRAGSTLTHEGVAGALALQTAALHDGANQTWHWNVAGGTLAIASDGTCLASPDLETTNVWSVGLLTGQLCCCL